MSEGTSGGGGWSRWLLGAPVLSARLAWFRAVFFGLLAFDQWYLMMERAPRYGAGGFNVSHLPWLDGVLPLPTAEVVTGARLLGGFLALRVALGMGGRWSMAGLAGIYGGVYLWSQADSYQHHYLLALIALLSVFLPYEDMPGLWRRGGGARPEVTRSWAAQLLYVQVSIVYFFTGVTKSGGDWLSGWAMERIVVEPEARAQMMEVASRLGMELLTFYQVSAWSIMLGQFLAATALMIPRLRPLACVVGPVFHVMVEFLDLKIGWFSWYMLGLYYVLLIPDRWFLALTRPLTSVWGRVRPGLTWLGASDGLGLGTRGVVGAGAGFLVGFITSQVPLSGVQGAGWALGLATLGVVMWRPRGWQAPTLVLAATHVLMAVVMYGVVAKTEVSFNYHRLWAGDLRRRGEVEAAIERYERANRLSGDGRGRYREVAELYERTGRVEEARAAYTRALELDPGDQRARQGLARLR